MSKTYTSRWIPPERPHWVSRVNEEGKCMDIRHVVPLDETSLISSAIDATGLDDFGDDDWLEPFRVYIKSLEEDANLNLVGRLRTRSDILILLQARLQIEETYKRHPEIAEEEIRQPLIVVGQGRSGTSFLINVLAADPDNGAARHWEMMFPCPPPEAATYHTDERIEKAHKLIDQWNRVTPTLTSMHEFGATIPMECCALLAINFMSPTWLHSFGQASTYDRYMATRDFRPALRYHRRVLKLLQWRNPRKHWVLKDPLHLDRIEMLLEIYPDACFIWPHRDPVRALASNVNLTGTVQWGRSDEPFRGNSFGYIVDPVQSAARLDAAIQKIEQGVVPASQIYHIKYLDLVREPLAVIESIYAHFSIELDSSRRAAIQRYLEKNRRDSRPAHKFGPGSSDMIADARTAYRNYQSYFGVADE